MFVVQYIVGIWVLCCWICNNSQVLRQCGPNTQPFPDESPNNNEYFNAKETTICEKTLGNNPNIGQDLMLI